MPGLRVTLGPQGPCHSEQVCYHRGGLRGHHEANEPRLWTGHHASDLYTEACAHKLITNLASSFPPWDYQGLWALVLKRWVSHIPAPFPPAILGRQLSPGRGLDSGMAASAEPFLNPSFVSPQCGGLLIP